MIERLCHVRQTYAILTEHHYLGPTKTAQFGWRDEFGVMVFSQPRSRRLPPSWLELSRWCLLSKSKNAGSRQWAGFAKFARNKLPQFTTIVSYSDPSVGHTGALYRACGWLWAPTWHRLRPPPSGNGSWIHGEQQSVKDRWVFPLQVDSARAGLLRVEDDALRTRFPWAEYIEPQTSRRGVRLGTGGGDYRRWRLTESAA